MNPVFGAILVLVAGSLAPALAQGAGGADPAGLDGFKTPSGNIHCQYFDGGSDKPPSANVLRCDIRSLANHIPRRPKDCDLDFGHAFEMNDRDGSARRLCYGDTALDDRLPVLAYGASWQRGGMSCKSDQSGVSCVNAKGHGFELSRNAQRLF